MYRTASRSFATSYIGQNRLSLRATPFTLLNNIAPRMASCFIARSSSRADAGGSFSGRVASAVKRLPRASMASLNSSLTSDARRTAVSGVSTCVPGVVSVSTCMVTPS